MVERDLIALSMFPRAAGEWRCHRDPTVLVSSIPTKIMSGEKPLHEKDIRRILMSSQVNLISIELALGAAGDSTAGVSLSELARLLHVANSTSRHFPRRTTDVLLGCGLASQTEKPGSHGRRLRARPRLIKALDRAMLPGIAAILGPQAAKRPREEVLRAWKDVLLLALGLEDAAEVDRLAIPASEKSVVLDPGLARRTLATLDATAVGVTMVLHSHTRENRTFTLDEIAKFLDEYGRGTLWRARRIVDTFQQFGFIVELPRVPGTPDRFRASPRLSELYRATLAPRLVRIRQSYGGQP